MTVVVYMSPREMEERSSSVASDKKRRTKHLVAVLITVTLIFALIIALAVILAFKIPLRNSDDRDGDGSDSDWPTGNDGKNSIKGRLLRAVLAVNMVGAKNASKQDFADKAQEFTLEVIRMVLRENLNSRIQFALLPFGTPENSTLSQFCEAACTLSAMDELLRTIDDNNSNPNQTDAILQYLMLRNATSTTINNDLILILFAADPSTYRHESDYVNDMRQSRKIIDEAHVVAQHSALMVADKQSAKFFNSSSTVISDTGQNPIEISKSIDQILKFKNKSPMWTQNGSSSTTTSSKNDTMVTEAPERSDTNRSLTFELNPFTESTVSGNDSLAANKFEYSSSTMKLSTESGSEFAGIQENHKQSDDGFIKSTTTGSPDHQSSQLAITNQPQDKSTRNTDGDSRLDGSSDHRLSESELSTSTPSDQLNVSNEVQKSPSTDIEIQSTTSEPLDNLTAMQTESDVIFSVVPQEAVRFTSPTQTFKSALTTVDMNHRESTDQFQNSSTVATQTETSAIDRSIDDIAYDLEGISNSTYSKQFSSTTSVPSGLTSEGDGTSKVNQLNPFSRTEAPELDYDVIDKLPTESFNKLLSTAEYYDDHDHRQISTSENFDASQTVPSILQPTTGVDQMRSTMPLIDEVDFDDQSVDDNIPADSSNLPTRIPILVRALDRFQKPKLAGQLDEAEESVYSAELPDFEQSTQTVHVLLAKQSPQPHQATGVTSGTDEIPRQTTESATTASQNESVSGDWMTISNASETVVTLPIAVEFEAIAPLTVKHSVNSLAASVKLEKNDSDHKSSTTDEQVQAAETGEANLTTSLSSGTTLKKFFFDSEQPILEQPSSTTATNIEATSNRTDSGDRINEDLLKVWGDDVELGAELNNLLNNHTVVQFETENGDAQRSSTIETKSGPGTHDS